MPRSKLSLPHERRKMALKSRAMNLQVGIAERRAQLDQVKAELAAMKPKPKPKDPLV